MSRSLLFLALAVPVAAHGAGFLWPGSSDAMDRYINGANGNSAGSDDFSPMSASSPPASNSFSDPWKSLNLKDGGDSSDSAAAAAPKKDEDENLSPIERATRAMDSQFDSGPSSMFSSDHHHEAQSEDAMDKVASDAKKGSKSSGFDWDNFGFNKETKSDDSQQQQENKQSADSGDQQDQSAGQQGSSDPAPITSDEMHPPQPAQDDGPQPTGQVFDVKLDSELQMEKKAKAALHRSDLATGLLDGR